MAPIAAALLPDLFDPATVALLRTAVLSGLVLAAGAIALAALPWTDEEIEEVDDSARRAARALLQPAARRATLRG